MFSCSLWELPKIFTGKIFARTFHSREHFHVFQATFEFVIWISSRHSNLTRKFSYFTCFVCVFKLIQFIMNMKKLQMQPNFHLFFFRLQFPYQKWKSGSTDYFLYMYVYRVSRFSECLTLGYAYHFLRYSKFECCSNTMNSPKRYWYGVWIKYLM